MNILCRKRYLLVDKKIYCSLQNTFLYVYYIHNSIYLRNYKTHLKLNQSCNLFHSAFKDITKIHIWMILGCNSFQDHNFKTFTNLEHVCLLFLSLGDYLKSLHFGSTSLFSDLLSHFSTKDMCTHIHEYTDKHTYM